jgi:hypothetical protein
MIDYIIEKQYSKEPSYKASTSLVDGSNDNVLKISKLYRYKMLLVLYDLCEISPIP